MFFNKKVEGEAFNKKGLTEPTFETVELPRHLSMAAVVSKHPPMPSAAWLMDTGCGHDLVGKKMVHGYQTQAAPVGKSGSITFATANGKIRTTEVVPMHCEVFGNEIAPFLLPETPPVLSVGKRCMEEQYDFHWIRGQKPLSLIHI